jgi:hypothetical protein
MREQLLKRFEAACGGSDADYHERSVSRVLLLGAIGVRIGLDARLRGISFFVAFARLVGDCFLFILLTRFSSFPTHV